MNVGSQRHNMKDKTVETDDLRNRKRLRDGHNCTDCKTKDCGCYGDGMIMPCKLWS
jgi:hypothetical protein